jgi:nicotinate-nucleotide pyrophosphorylase (carboxylating)
VTLDPLTPLDLAALEPTRAVVAPIVALALAEDLGRGDLTTTATVPWDARGEAALVARRPLVLAGAFLVREVYAQIDPEVVIDLRARDGESLTVGQTALVLRGRAASLLRGERVALNFIQRASGVATLTRRYVDALPPGSRTRVTDTRKTTPGLRAIERYAVRAGGGHNHREDLGSAVLIKDNHIAACGSLGLAVRRARAHAPHTCRVTCEVETFDQLDEALAAGADVVMLDNFDDDDLERAVARVAGRAIIEVSGGVTLERVPRIAAAGVDVISVGALTHSAPAADLALDWLP